MASWEHIICACALTLTLTLGVTAGGDKPCAPRQYPGKSIGCVCNNTYCDEITRDPPAANHYVAYTSSEAGSRFKKSEGELHSYYMWNEGRSYTLELDPATTYQTVEGFGGAVTDSVGIHWANLTARLQAHLINSYFGKQGIEYNMVRLPIGGSDFSTHEYAYNELPKDDELLSNYSLSIEDHNLKIPLIKHIKEVVTTPLHIVATTWSPPPWMKTNEKFRGLSAIKPKYYQAYALYHAKFIREYKKNGIDIWAITTTNEPENAYLPFARFQTLGWTANNMGKWIIENLGPTIRNASDLQHVKILTVDDQRFTIPIWFNEMVDKHPKVLDYIDGVAVHWYGDKLVSPELLKLVTEKYPNKFVIGTEACEGYTELFHNTSGALKYREPSGCLLDIATTCSFPWEKEKVSLGNWDRAKSYITDIITDLNYNLVGWIDWNICLDEQGGPNWVKNFVDSPVIVFPELDEIVKQPMFYAMGHVSKWIPRGSVRIQVTEQKGLFETSLNQVAFLTPQNTIVVVIHNSDKARRVRVQLGEVHAVLDLEKSSITTAEFAYSSTT